MRSPSPKHHCLALCLSLLLSSSHTHFSGHTTASPVCEVGPGAPVPLPAGCPPLTVCSPAAEGYGAEARVQEAWLREQEVGVGSRRLGGEQEGRPQVGCGRPVPSPCADPQELSKRQVVAVGHLEVPVELAGPLRAVAGTSVLGAVRGG